MKEEFLELLSDYQGIIHKVNLIYFRNRMDREDNFQEIVYQLWKSFARLKNKNSIGSWVYAVAINTSISRVKKISKIEFHETPFEAQYVENNTEEMTLDDDVKQLLDAIYRLNEIDKSIMLLYLEEKSYAEIAGILGISVSNVGVHINRAKEILKHNLIK
jgi:RNA polymerase sigma-70 factor, ECF subfamily